MVVFDGMIRHRGGAPSKFCLAPRISLAIKFGPVNRKTEQALRNLPSGGC
jgi:hypothetical protein